MALQSTHDVGIYCRLSRDDNNGNLESMSIGNQKQMLVDYVKEKGWNLRETYVDDGYSGTNFDRPDFKRMIQDVKNARIDCIVTKDLSRLGRNYSKVGYYTEEFFVDHGVRFIAINDSFDTNREEDNDIAPFKNVLNEWYPRDISKKVRQVKRAAARQGKFMGSYAPYGYKRHPENKHQLIIDDKVADIVRRIFNESAYGYSGRRIADNLNADGIDTPKFYSAKEGNGMPVRPTEKNFWGSSTVLRIIRHPVYIGTLVQCKSQVTSFKNKKRRVVDRDNWIVVENTHEPIIDREIWDRCQSRARRTRNRESKKTNSISLFAGLLRCEDCGSKLVFTFKPRKKGPSVGSYRCSCYNNNGNHACTHHYIQENTLSAFVLRDIQIHATLVKADRERITQQLLAGINNAQQNSMKQIDKQLRDAESREAAIDENIKQLYEDKCEGKLPESIFQKLLNGYLAEQAELSEAINKIRDQQNEVKIENCDINQWMDTISGYMDLKKLDRTSVVELIDTITIGEGRMVNGKRRQDITINYRFIGNLLEHAKEDII